MSFQVLIEEEKIKKRIQEMGAEISKAYAKSDKLIVLGILKGSFIFLADLVRTLKIPCEIDFIEVSSYGEGTVSSGEVKMLRDVRTDLRGRDVIVVEDIVDTGQTLFYLLEHLKKKYQPKSLKVCSLLHKPSRQIKQVPVDFLGFTIEDHFVIGYGLDFNNRFRELKEVVIYSEADDPQLAKGM